MPTFIKTGFWEKRKKGFDHWLNIDDIIDENIGSTTVIENNPVIQNITNITEETIVIQDILRYPLENSYTTSSVMFGDQINQTQSYFQYVIDIDTYYEYLGTTTASVADYRELTADETTTIILNGRSKKPIAANYADAATMYSTPNQRKQISGFIYRVNTDDSYYEYLGTRNGNATDYKQIGGASAVTASNGLTKVGDDVQLGGTLTSSATITGNGTNRVNITNSAASGLSLLVSSPTSTGGALTASATNGTPIRSVRTGEGLSLDIAQASSGTNNSTVLVSLNRTTSGTPVNGFGAELRYNLEHTTSSHDASWLRTLWTDATGATRTSQFQIDLLNSTIQQSVLTINGNGSTQLNQYGGGTITGTPAYNLVVDADGYVIEKSLGKSLTTDATTTYNFVLADANNIVTLDNGAAVSAVIPSNGSVAYPIGTEITIINLGAGTVTVSVTTDTINQNVGGLTLAQYDKRTVTKVTATSWILGY